MNGIDGFAAATTVAAVAAGAASPVSTANSAENKPGAERRCSSFDSREQLSSDILDAPCVIC